MAALQNGITNTIARTFRSLRVPQLPAVLRRPDRLAERHLDAVGRPGLARRAPHRQRPAAGPDRGPAVRPRAGRRARGRPDSRPHRQAQAADRHADGHDRAGGGPRCAHAHRGGARLDDPRAGDALRRDERARQPGAAGLRDRDGRRGRRRERRLAEQRDRQCLAGRRARVRRHPDRHAGSRRLFSGQRRLVSVRHRGARGDALGGAASHPAVATRGRPVAGRSSPMCGAPPSCACRS